MYFEVDKSQFQPTIIFIWLEQYGHFLHDNEDTWSLLSGMDKDHNYILFFGEHYEHDTEETEFLSSGIDKYHNYILFLCVHYEHDDSILVDLL